MSQYEEEEKGTQENLSSFIQGFTGKKSFKNFSIGVGIF